MRDILDELTAKGVRADIIAEIEKWGAAYERRRALQRAASRKYRADKETVRLTASREVDAPQVIENTQQRQPYAAPLLTTSSLDLFSEEKQVRAESVSHGRPSRRRPMTELPDNWHPELAGEIEWEKFCDHARQTDRRCADWEAAWRNWNRNAPNFNGGGQRDVRGRRHGSALDALDRLEAKLRAAGATDGYIPGSSGPQPLDQKVRPINPKLVSSR